MITSPRAPIAHPAWLFICLAASATCRAQCDGSWLPGMSVPGVGGTATCSRVFDDGSGPSLFVGGEFRIAGDATVNFVGRWDGERFQGLAGGTDRPVYAMTEHEGQLVVAGDFNFAGGMPIRGVAGWDGTEWRPFGTGLAIELPGVTRRLAAASFNGDLFIGGPFGISRWDGARWISESGGDTRAMAVCNGEIYSVTGGLRKRIGTSWFTVWNASQLETLVEINGLLYIGGNFSRSTVEGITARSIVAFDGTAFHYVGPGVTGSITAAVRCISTNGGSVAIGRDFTQQLHAPDPPTALMRVGVLEQDQWQPLGEGIPTQPATLSNLIMINSLAEFNGRLYAMGCFFRAGASDTFHFASWDGARWHSLVGGPVTSASDDQLVTCLEPHQGSLVVAGSFTSIAGVAANHIAARTGAEWASLGEGFPEGQPVHDLASFSGNLIAAGAFNSAGGIPVSGIASWNGTSWESFGGGITGTPFALLAEDQTLTVGGSFSAAGGVPAASLAEWDGTSWTALATSVNGPVRAIARYQGDLVVGGDMTMIDGVPVNRVARWNGSTWTPMGDGFSGRVRALIPYGPDLYAGGSFLSSGSTGVELRTIARWDGTDWRPVEGLVQGTAQPLISSMAVYQDQLYAGGTVVGVAGASSPAVARWDGASWLPLEPALTVSAVSSTHPIAMAPFDGTLCISGDIETAGGGVSFCLAQWVAETCCDPDVNCDGALNGFDVQATEEAVNGDFTNFCLPSADLNGDGSENGFDIETEEQRVNGAPC